MDFKSFKNNFTRENEANNDFSGAGETVKDTAKKYAGASRDELLDEIIKQASEGKKNGTLNERTLDSFYQSVAPMLNPEQRNRMRSVINMLKTKK